MPVTDTTAAAAAAAAPSRKQLEHALLLIARQHGGDATSARAAQDEFARWRQAAPVHEIAAQAALRGWAATDASSLRDAVQLPPRVTHNRRRVFQALGLAAMAVAVAGSSRWYWLQPLERLSLRTGRAELLGRRLQDGSQIDLAPRTRAEISLYRDHREVRLAEGQMRFEVVPDASRPFEVLTGFGRVRVLGTAFTVAVRDQCMTVAVAHGRVAVWPGNEGVHGGYDVTRAPALTLDVGQTVRSDAQGLGPVGVVASGDVGAWRQGWLVFDRTPLPEVLERWNDYLRQQLVLSNDPALRALRLTGSFPAGNPDAFVTSLPQVLPVQISEVERGVRVVSMRR